MTTDAPPLVTVILLCHNHEQFVDEALRGVLAQTYAPLDIVIIDDASTDRTPDVVVTALAGLGRSDIRFLRNPRNLGLLGACHVAIKAARGEFVVFTCDDDIMLPRMVEEMVALWRSAGVSLVTTNADYIDDRSQPIGRSRLDDVPQDDTFETLVRDGSNACCFGATMGFEREVYQRFGLAPEHLNNLDIILPFHAYLLKGARYLPKPLLKYRIHGQNNSLSLIEDRSAELGKLETRERIFLGHLAHAVVMMDELDRLAETMPDRYREIAPRIGPLLAIQAVEMGKKYVRNRVQLLEARRHQT